jgi:hypothetical protein
MAAAAQRIADLEQQVAALSARVEQLAATASVIRTLNELMLVRAGYGADDHAGLKPSRPRHLMAVPGGRQ